MYFFIFADETRRIHMSDEEEEEEDAVLPKEILSQHLAHLADAISEESDDDSADESVKKPPLAQPCLHTVRPGPQDSKAAAAVDARGERSAAPASVLPAAEDALDPAVEKPGFLHVDGPEFDASQHFRPPPVSAADLMPVGEGVQRNVRPFADTSEVQRYDPEANFGHVHGAVRLRGSVCFETDDERGRRVKYGAHQMLKADPWSDCNPNFAMHKGKRKR
jgi:hypothetical protein